MNDAMMAAYGGNRELAGKCRRLARSLSRDDENEFRLLALEYDLKATTYYDERLLEDQKRVVSALCRELSANRRVARLRDLFQQAEIAVTATDTKLRGGPHILFANPAFERLSGYSAAELIGRTSGMFDGPATDLGRIRGFLEELVTAAVAEVSAVQYRKSGHAYPCSILGGRTAGPTALCDQPALVAFTRDISETAPGA
jgi:PAS domain S-box-containing protein